MQRVQIDLVDDLDGSAAEETVNFAVDGREYEIDLSSKNASKIREFLAPYVDKGRRTGGGRRGNVASKSTSGNTKADGLDLKAIREWATKNGKEVSSRGRLPKQLVEEYQAAQ